MLLMLGKKYRLKVYESALHRIHGFGYEIEEIYFPELGIAMNRRAIFRTGPERYTEAVEMGTVEVDDADVEVLKQYVFGRERAKQIARSYFE
jgi:hypothetical protein